MEKVTATEKQEFGTETRKAKQKGVLQELQKAIAACRELTQGYERSPDPSPVLLFKLANLEMELLDEFFHVSTFAEKRVPRAKRKPEKQAVPVPKVGA